MEKSELYALAYGFQLTGEIQDITTFGDGHINSTFLITTNLEKYILQKINSYVFKDVKSLMNNIELVTSFIKNKGKETLEIVKTKDNQLYKKHNDGYYRIYVFVKDTVCYQKINGDLSLVSSLGSSFGDLHHLLNDLDASLIKETIPHFHDTPHRFNNFLDALQFADKEKIEKAKEEIKFIKEQKNTYSKITDAIKEGKIKIHITHNDTKINNVLFDKTTNKYRLVIDLDTVMPGTILYDIGDAFRGLFTGDNEDNTDTSLLKVDISIYKAFLASYIKEMKKELNEIEVSLIPFSIYLMTIECGMRFLEDYLRNNVYFAVKYENHNLIRARSQIALAKDVLNNMENLKEIVEEIYHD